MIEFCQGDIIKISGYKKLKFVIVSKNAFIRATKVFHVCPLLPDIPPGPLHLSIKGKNGDTGTVVCEQMKMIDPDERGISKIDTLKYEDIMNISDAIQGIFEYD